MGVATGLDQLLQSSPRNAWSPITARATWIEGHEKRKFWGPAADLTGGARDTGAPRRHREPRLLPCTPRCSALPHRWPRTLDVLSDLLWATSRGR